MKIKPNKPTYDKARSKITLDYRVSVNMFSFPNEMVGGAIPAVKFSLYLMEKRTKYVGSQEPIHYQVHNKPHLAP